MPTTDWNLAQTWFNYFAILAWVFIPVVVAPIAKMAKTFDKKANMCGSWARYLPGIIPITVFVFVHLGLYTPALFLHINESDPADDSYYDIINWVIWAGGLVLAFFPHVYTLNWYSYRQHMKWDFSKSFTWMSKISIFLTPVLMFCAFGLFLIGVVLTATDDRWVPFGLYLGYSVVLFAAFVFFTLEAIFCANKYRAYSRYSGNETTVNILLKIEEDTERRNEPDEEEMERGQVRSYGGGRGGRRKERYMGESREYHKMARRRKNIPYEGMYEEY
jgi:hypothetical protein